jgi:hypothetical protein
MWSRGNWNDEAKVEKKVIHFIIRILMLRVIRFGVDYTMSYCKK